MNSSESVVMVLDDDPAVAAAVQRGLRRLWPSNLPLLRMVIHTEPTAAISDLIIQPVDVIVADYRMPLMDGVEFFRHARGLQPDAARILLSGSPDFQGLLRAVNQGGAAQVLLKPWDEDELVMLVSCLVHQRRLNIEEATQAQAWRDVTGVVGQDEPRQKSLLPPTWEVIQVDDLPDLDGAKAT